MGFTKRSKQKPLHCLYEKLHVPLWRDNTNQTRHQVGAHVMTHLVPHLSVKRNLKKKDMRLVSFTSLASPANTVASHRSSPAGPTPLCLCSQTSWDLPVLCADDVAVKTQQVQGGCRPPLRCSGTTGVLICTLSQPSL